MKFRVFLMFFAATMSAQSGHKKTCEPPETIPHSAVEPVTADTKPTCPRDEYELKWFVEEYEATNNNVYWCANSAGCVQPSQHAQGFLYFKPMCVKKDLPDAKPAVSGTAADGPGF